MTKHPFRPGPLLLATAALVAGAATTPDVAPAQTADFLFERPAISIGFHGGIISPRADSDIFSEARRELTIGGDAFRSSIWGVDVEIGAAERVSVEIALGFATASVDSEYRHWVGDDDLPIPQTTTFRRRPLTATLKGYPMERGQSVGNLAWIPARFAPYVGIGGGWVWYTFEQSGEFFDPETLIIYGDVLTSNGSGPVGHVEAGLDFTLHPRMVLTGAGRYSWSAAKTGQDFEGWDDIDLSGASATIGLAIRM